MTEKELLYFEDAIKHEENIIKIVKDNLESIDDKKIIKFLNNEIQEHTKMKNKLLSVLEGLVNE